MAVKMDVKQGVLEYVASEANSADNIASLYQSAINDLGSIPDETLRKDQSVISLHDLTMGIMKGCELLLTDPMLPPVTCFPT